MIRLSGLELFFIITTVISLVVNIVQFIRISPLYNSLCGLMNDCRIKAKYYNEHISDDREICQKIIADLEGFGQHIYGTLKTIKSKDKAFSAHPFTQTERTNKTEG